MGVKTILWREVNGNYIPIRKLGPKSFYAGGQSFILDEYVDIDANKIERFRATIESYDRMNISTTNMKWRIDY